MGMRTQTLPTVRVLGTRRPPIVNLSVTEMTKTFIEGSAKRPQKDETFPPSSPRVNLMEVYENELK